MLFNISPILNAECELAPLVQMRLEQPISFHCRVCLSDHLSHRELGRLFGREDERFFQPYEVVLDGQGCVPWRAPFVINGFAFFVAQLAIPSPKFADYLPRMIRRSIHYCADAFTNDSPVRWLDRGVQSPDHCLHASLKFVLDQCVRLAHSVE